MKIINYLFCLLPFIVSCKKEAIKTPDFSVAVDKMSYNVGDTVKFNFTGRADHIVLFSGEPTHEYAHRQRTTIDDVELFLSFSSRTQSGVQDDQVKILLSSDFDGIYDTANIKSATWKDVTERFEFASSNKSTPSGEQPVLDALDQADKPFYVAFQYITRNQREYGKQRNWYINNFRLTAQSAIGETTLADQPGAAFVLRSMGPKEDGRTSQTGSTITFRGNSEDQDSYTEDWAVSKSFNPFTIMPDLGISIKNYSDNMPASYEHVYTAPGEYTVTFIGRNDDVSDVKESIKEFKIQVN